MSYVSPIKINDIKELPDVTKQIEDYAKYIAGEIDSLVMREVHKVSCEVDEEELIKALQYDRGQYQKGYEDGKREAADAIEALQAEIRESMQRCAECGDELAQQLPKRGEWLPYEFNTNGTWHKCSVCGVAYQYKDAPNSGWWIKHKYCPNCGAKMEAQE